VKSKEKSKGKFMGRFFLVALPLNSGTHWPLLLLALQAKV
jgi:hypothetical protein